MIKNFIFGFMVCWFLSTVFYALATSPEFRTEFNTPEQIKATLGEWSITMQPRNHRYTARASTPTAFEIEEGYWVIYASGTTVNGFTKWNGDRYFFPGVKLD